MRISPASAPPSQIVIPVDRETGRPRGFAFVEFLDRADGRGGHQPVQPAAVHGPLALGERGRPREERPAGGFRPSGGGGPAAGSASTGGGGFGGPRPMGGGPAASARAALRREMPGAPGRNFGPPKKKSARARSAGRTRSAARRARSRSATPAGWAGSTTTRTTLVEPMPDFDDPASRAAEEDKDEE